MTEFCGYRGWGSVAELDSMLTPRKSARLYLEREAGLVSEESALASEPEGRLALTLSGTPYQCLEGRVERMSPETLLSLYRERGPRAFKCLQGAYALALWDGPQGKLYLGRDHLGLESLFCWREGSFLFFSNRLKSLLRCSEVRAKGASIDILALEHFLTYLSPPLETTLLKGIFKPLPGVFFTGESPAFPEAERWEVLRQEVPAEREELPRRIKAHLRESLQELASAVPEEEPIGLLLSGGLDSTALLFLLKELRGEGIHTFTVGLPGNPDLRWARLISKEAGCIHHEACLEPEDVGPGLESTISATGEPSGNPSAIGLLKAFQMAKEEVKYIFAGLGADELFGGHRKHVLAQAWPLLSRVPSSLRGAVPRALGLFLGRLDLSRRGRLLSEAGGTPKSLHGSMYAFFPQRERELFLSDSALRELSRLKKENPQPVRGAPWDEDWFDPLASLDVSLWLLGSLCATWGSLASAVGLTLRLPFCNHRLLGLGLSVPISSKVRGLGAKLPLRRALGEMVPRGVLKRRPQGFTLPLGGWLRHDLRSFLLDRLAPERLEPLGYLNPPAVQALLAEHLSGRADHTQSLWAFMALAEWHRQVAEVNGHWK